MDVTKKVGSLSIVESPNPLNTELNPICHLLALIGGATIVVVSRLRVNGCNKECRQFIYY
jgi:hypothetical protein